MPLSGLILLAVGVVRGAPPCPSGRMWGPIALTGLFNMGLFQIFLISGIAMLGPSRTPIIIYTMPAWSALFAVFLLKERITLRVALSLVLSLVGGRHHRQPGDGGANGAHRHLAHAARGHLLRHRHGADQAHSFRGDPTINAAWQILLGTLPVIAGLAGLSARDAYFRPDQTRGIAALAWLILVSNVLAYFCWFRIIRALPASVASLTTLVVPCVGFGSSALLIGGDISWLDVVALWPDHRCRDAGAGQRETADAPRRRRPSRRSSGSSRARARAGCAHGFAR